MNVQISAQNQIEPIPQEIQTCLKIIKGLWLLGLVHITWLLIRLITGSQFINQAADLAELKSAAVFCITYYVLDTMIRKGDKSALQFLAVTGIFNLVIVLLIIGYGLLLGLEGWHGGWGTYTKNFGDNIILIITLLICLLPTAAALLAYQGSEFFKKDTTTIPKPGIAILAGVLAFKNAFSLGLGFILLTNWL